MCIASNILGQILLTLNCLLYHQNESVPVWNLAVMWAGMCGFTWADYQWLRAIREYITQKYELAHFLEPEITEFMSCEMVDAPAATQNESTTAA